MTSLPRPRPLILPAAPAEQAAVLAAGGVAVWREPLVIPTYEPGEPEKHPMFLDRRVYQGSSGRVHPLPFIESVATEPVDRAWDAIHVENTWIRLVILPELGGRIHVGYDKIHDYDFFYRNSVIKPALVGLAGPWVSGGVEFNWPQHHRPATFLPVDTEIETDDDGTVTVWNSDHDPFARMKGMHGIRLRGDSSVIELAVRLHNRTEDVQTFLWWANVAARAHEQYQSFFPTDVQYVADHARRAVTAFPRADRAYYDVDYPERARTIHPDADRIDIYSNIPVPTSYMVLETEDDFFGGYDHRADAGFVHWADRRIAPGKKQWTWGNSDFGHAWDSLLTDVDGPYVELMAGVYTDNQPDFSYLAPGETRTFSQYWFPIAHIGPAHQATTDLAVSLTVRDGVAHVGIAPTTDRSLRAELRDASGTVVDARALAAGPAGPATYEVTVDLADDRQHELQLVVVDAETSTELVRWRHRDPAVRAEEPLTATEPPLPADITSIDELYLTGVHLAQYRHPTRDAEPYWEEALRRDSVDSRSAIALAARRYLDGRFSEAHELLDRAISRLTFRNPNPTDGEAHYRLGLVRERLDDPSGAYDAFAKAAWDSRWIAPARLRMAALDAAAGRNAEAHENVALARRRDADDLRARCLEVIVLRRLSRHDDAAALLAESRRLDPLDQWTRLLDDAPLTSDARTLVDVALDSAWCGETAVAVTLLERATSVAPTAAGGIAPVAHYLRARLLHRGGDHEAAATARAAARTADARWCFPAGIDALLALESAISAEPDDARAHALLGTWLYDRRRRDDALEAWRTAVRLDPTDTGALRNAAVATVAVESDTASAAALYEQAIAIDSDDARLWFESDQLAHRRGVSSAERRTRLESAPESVVRRNDLLVELALLRIDTGDPAGAVSLLLSRPLQPWEGGEGRALGAWELAHAALAERALDAGDHEAALRFARDGRATPPSLGEARSILDVPARLILAEGRALAATDPEAARVVLHEAARAALARAETRVDDSTAWAARAALEAGDHALSDDLRNRVLLEISRLQSERARIDYFATSLPTLVLFPESPDEIAARTINALQNSLSATELSPSSAVEG